MSFAVARLCLVYNSLAGIAARGSVELSSKMHLGDPCEGKALETVGGTVLFHNRRVGEKRRYFVSQQLERDGPKSLEKRLKHGKKVEGRGEGAVLNASLGLCSLSLLEGGEGVEGWRGGGQGFYGDLL